MFKAIYNSGYFFWITGFLAGQLVCILSAKRNGIKRYQAFLYGVINLVIMCVGAKILYIIENFDYVRANGIGFGGFSLFGAVYIQILSCLVISSVFKQKMTETADIIVIQTVVMLAFYRIDCLRNGCCGGITLGGYTVPTQILESAFCALSAAVFIWLKYKARVKAGLLFVIFFIAYGVFRFVVEFFRVRTYLIGMISFSHLLALLSVVLGLIWMEFFVKRKAD